MGPKITIQGGGDSTIAGPVNIRSTIVENTSGGQLTIAGDPWVNDGSLDLGNGATLDLYGNWTNQGTITVAAGSTVGLGSPINISPTNVAPPAYVWSNQGTLAIANGAIVEPGRRFHHGRSPRPGCGFCRRRAEPGQLYDQLDGDAGQQRCGQRPECRRPGPRASTGPLNLAGGRIYQGMITTSGSDHLVASEYLLSDNLNSFMDYEITGGTLDGVTLDGTLDIPLGCGTEILGSLTLNGTIDIGGRRKPGLWGDLGQCGTGNQRHGHDPVRSGRQPAQL